MQFYHPHGWHGWIDRVFSFALAAAALDAARTWLALPRTSGTTGA